MGRTQSDRELWIACNTFEALATAERLTFPLRIETTSRPDFTLEFASGRIGIEVTELVDEKLAKAFARANQELLNDPLAFVPDKRRVALQREQRWGSNGLEWEAEWGGALRKRVDSKRESAMKPGFKLFERNWLLVYKNLLGMRVVQIDVALRALIDQRLELAPFDTLLILSTPELVIYRTSSFEIYPAPMLKGSYEGLS